MSTVQQDRQVPRTTAMEITAMIWWSTIALFVTFLAFQVWVGAALSALGFLVNHQVNQYVTESAQIEHQPWGWTTRTPR